MKQTLKIYLPIALMAVIFVIVFAGCKKDVSDNKPNYGNAPRKPVPAELVGTWLSTHVSGSTINYPGGRTEPTWAQGFAFTIHADGTGIAIVSAETHSYTAETYSRVDQDCTFEIDLNNDDSMILKFYVVSGKVYENNVFLHNLDASKCYPQKVFSANTCTFGENAAGKYFETGGERFFKK